MNRQIEMESKEETQKINRSAENRTGSKLYGGSIEWLDIMNENL
jgi:hypothetical protein